MKAEEGWGQSETEAVVSPFDGETGHAGHLVPPLVVVYPLDSQLVV